MLVEEVNSLLARLVHGLLVLLRVPVSTQCESMNLVLVDTHLGVDTLALLLGHELLDLVHLLVSEQAVRVTERKRCRNSESLKVARDGNERRVACVDGVNTHALSTAEVLVSGQDGISATPAEANRSDLVGTGDHADLLDEALDQGASDTLAVLKQPRAESCASLCCGGSLLCEGTRVTLGLLRLDGLKEFNVERVALMDIGNVGSEAVGGILVGEQTSVLELPTKDWLTLVSESMKIGDEDLLSTRKMTVLDLLASLGSAT